MQNKFKKLLSMILVLSMLSTLGASFAEGEMDTAPEQIQLTEESFEEAATETEKQVEATDQDKEIESEVVETSEADDLVEEERSEIEGSLEATAEIEPTSQEELEVEASEIVKADAEIALVEETVSSVELEDEFVVAQVEVPTEDEVAAAEEIEVVDDQNLLESMPGDYILSTDTTADILIPAGAGAMAYGSYMMETAGLLTFEFTSPTAGGNVSITIKDIDNNTMWSNNWVSNVGSVTCSEFAEAGEYTITFAKSSPADTNSYQLTARAITSRTGELATRNNTANNAGTMTIGQEMTGIWSYQDIQQVRNDYYKFTLSEPGWVTINFTNKTMGTLNLYLYGDDTSTENEVTAFSTNGPACADRNESDSVTINHSGWLDAGIYYIRIVGSNQNGRYTIRVSNSPITITEVEKNNSFSLAYNSGSELSLTGNWTESLLSESNHEDCYWFNLPIATEVGFSVKIQFRGVSAAIYTREGTMVPGSSFGSNSTSGSDGNPYTLNTSIALPAGTYYLRISWSAGQYCGKYSVTGYQRLKISDVETVLNGATLQLRTIYTIYRNYVNHFSFVLEREDPRFPGSGSYYTIGSIDDIDSPVVEVVIPGNGNYRVHAAISDGEGWTDYWKTFTVNTLIPMQVQSVQATSDDAIVHIKAVVTGTNTEIIASRFVLRNASGVVVDAYEGKNEKEHDLRATATGTYTVEYACTVDGIIWENGTTQVYVSASATLTIAAMSFQVRSDGLVTATVSQSTGAAIYDGWFEFYNGYVQVANVHSGSSLKAVVSLTPGTYVVHYAGYNGVWAEYWDTLVVPAASVLTINSLTATPDSTGKVFIQAKTSGGAGIVYGVFNIYKDNVLYATIETTDSAITWQAPVSGTYAIQYVAFDGFTWVPQWTSTVVTIAPISPFAIYSVNIAVDGTTAYVTVNTNDDRPVDGVFVLYRDGNPVAIEYTESRNYTFEGLPVAGYAIHYAATDGATWQDIWQVFTVSTTLSINSVTATRSGAYVYVNAAVTNATPIREAYMVLYNWAGEEITRYVYTGSGEYLTHTFNVGDNPAAIQYVVFDGLKWVEMWAPVV